MARRSSVLARCIPAVAVLLACTGAGGEPAADAEAQSYRFVLVGAGKQKEVPFRGLISVDGKDRLVLGETTPFEFRCESGSVIAGYFEVLGPEGAFTLRVFDPGHSDRKPYAWAKRQRRIRFSWARPGVGPRCLDLGGTTDACPASTPAAAELRRRLEALAEADAREGP